MRSLIKVIKSWWFPWLIMGIFLRLIMAAVTVHPHAWDLNFSGYLFAFKHVTNIYDYLATLPSDNLWVKLYGRGVFTYPPLAYFTLGFLMLVFKPFYNLNFMEWFVKHPLNDSLGNTGLFWHLFLLKLPYLFFDLGVAFLLVKILGPDQRRKIVFKLWLFNPLSFYTSFIVSQFDIIPVFFVVLALFLALKEKKHLSLISLSIGGGFKLFPLWLVPLFALILGKDFRERIKLLFCGIFPYLLTILPFVSSPAFRQTVLFSNQSQKMLFMGLPVSGAEVLYVFVVVLFLIWFRVYYKRVEKEKIWVFILLTFLLFFSVTHYHPQWFLWITPFLILELVYSRFEHLFLVLVLFGCWLGITLFFEPSLSYGAFSPIWPQLATVQGFSEVLSSHINVFMVKSLIRSVFAGASLALTFFLFTAKKTNV